MFQTSQMWLQALGREVARSGNSTKRFELKLHHRERKQVLSNVGDKLAWGRAPADCL
jgi:hypothetical protein